MSYPRSRLALGAAAIAVTGAVAGRIIRGLRDYIQNGQLWAGTCPECGLTMPYWGHEATLFRVWFVDASLMRMAWTCDNCGTENESKLTAEAWEWFRKRQASRGDDLERDEMENPISFDELHDFISNGGLDDIESAFVMTDDGVTNVARRERASKTNKANQTGSGTLGTSPARRGDDND